MEDIFEQDREDTLQPSEKSLCQKLLLTVSVKDKLFTEEQRNTAKKLLQRLEGDRRRKCRTSEGEPIRRRVDAHVEVLASTSPAIHEALLIRSSKRKRKKRTPKENIANEYLNQSKEEEEDEDDEEEMTKKKRKIDSESLD